MQKRAAKVKIALVVLAVLLLVIVCAGMVFAVSANVQEVLDRLATLQNANIDPDWLPDVRANESSVQALLDNYLRCSTAEQKEFTTAQNSDLRAYFEALYEVQGKDPASVDAIFAGAVPAASSARSSGVASASVSQRSSSVAPSSASAASSVSSVGTSSLVPSSSVALGTAAVSGVSSVSRASMPQMFFSPQVPQGGWGDLWGNRSVGAVWMLVLSGCIVLVLIQFLVAIRRAKHGKKDLQYEEKTGAVMGTEISIGMPIVQQKEKKTKKRREKAREEKTAVELSEQREENFQQLGEKEDAALKKEENRVPDVEPTAEASSFTQPRSASVALQSFASQSPEKPWQSKEKKAGRPSEAASVASEEQDEGIEAPPVRARVNPHRPVTGKPGKMPFRQGTPDDIDAIDE